MEQPISGKQPIVPEHRLLKRIGVGAYGEVWLARNVMGMPRAVKVVWRDRFEHQRIYEREYTGLQHVEPVSRLHPGIVDILQVGRAENDYFYYVMELADAVGGVGGVEWTNPESYEPTTLAERLRTQGALSVMECARIGVAISDALGFLHGNGLVHRDVKPSNIIFVGGQPKLADIGLIEGLKNAGSFVGTEGYIPPEGPGSVQADLFSLGKVLYEMVTGQSRHDFPDLPAEWRHTPEPIHFSELNETLLRACAPRPDQRHASASELKDELLLIEAGRSVRRLRRSERILKRWRRFGITTALLSVIGITAALLGRDATLRANRRAHLESTLRQQIEVQELRSRQALYAADINLAQQAVEVGNFGRAEELLDNYVPEKGRGDLRGFEWFYLWNRIRGDTRQVLRGHQELISSLVLGREASRLYSGSFDGSVKEWDVELGRELRQWSWPNRAVLALNVSPNGNLLAIQLDSPNETILLNLKDETSRVHSSMRSPRIVFSPDGARYLRSTGMVLFETEAQVQVVETDTGNIQHTLKESGGRAWFAPHGKLLVTGPWQDSLKLWSWPDLKLLGTFSDTGTVMDLAFVSNSSEFVTVSREGQLQHWDVAERRQLATTNAHGESVIWSVSISPDDTHVATAANDQTVRLSDLATLNERHVFRGHGSEVWSVVWMANGRYLASGGKDATIRLWDSEPKETSYEAHDVAQTPVFSPDDNLLALRSVALGVVVVDLCTGKERYRLGHAIEIGGFSNDGSSLSLLRDHWTVEWYSMSDGQLLKSRQVEVKQQAITSRLLSASGNWLVLGTETGEIQLYDVHTSDKPRLLSGHTRRIFSLEIDPDENRLLSGSRDLTVRLWDLGTGKDLGMFAGHAMSVSALAFASDAIRIASGSWDDKVLVWDSVTGLQLGVYGGHSESVHAIAFSPETRTLAVMSGGGELRLWNLATDREAGIFQLDRGTGMGSVQFSPKGTWLAAVSPPGRLTLLAAPKLSEEGK